MGSGWRALGYIGCRQRIAAGCHLINDGGVNGHRESPAFRFHPRRVRRHGEQPPGFRLRQSIESRFRVCAVSVHHIGSRNEVRRSFFLIYKENRAVLLHHRGQSLQIQPEAEAVAFQRLLHQNAFLYMIAVQLILEIHARIDRLIAHLSTQARRRNLRFQRGGVFYGVRPQGTAGFLIRVTDLRYRIAVISWLADFRLRGGNGFLRRRRSCLGRFCRCFCSVPPHQILRFRSASVFLRRVRSLKRISGIFVVFCKWHSRFPAGSVGNSPCGFRTVRPFFCQ